MMKILVSILWVKTKIKRFDKNFNYKDTAVY